MQPIYANDWVRLQQPLPALALAIGDVGRVVAAWFYPNTAYEVEFPTAKIPCARRVLLLQDQIAKQ
jgi:hypothetical protein